MYDHLPCRGAVVTASLLIAATVASAQNWASTATKAFPVQNLKNATLVGPLAPSTSIHVVLGLQAQNAGQIQPTLKAMLTPGNALNGTSLTLQQFVTQFGATSAQVQAVEGTLLAGLWSGIALWDGIPNVAGFCDACIWVTTAKGASAMLRVVTYGSTSTNSIDTSPSAYQDLNMNEYPRSMTWQFAKCPDTGAMIYEFQTGSSQYWTSLWVRNARVPLMKVEVESANHSSWTELTRGTDGTLTDASGFGMGMFSIRSTGVDGQTVVDTFAWPSTGIAGAFLTGQGNFE